MLSNTPTSQIIPALGTQAASVSLAQTLQAGWAPTAVPAQGHSDLAGAGSPCSPQHLLQAWQSHGEQAGERWAVRGGSAPGSHCARPHTSPVALGAVAGPRAVPFRRHWGAACSRLPLSHPGVARNIRAGQDTQLARNSTRLSSHPHPALHTTHTLGRHTEQRAWHGHGQLHVRPAPNEGAQTRTEPCTHPQPSANTRTHTCTQTHLHANAGWGTRASSALLLRPALPMQILLHHANPQPGGPGSPVGCKLPFGGRWGGGQRVVTPHPLRLGTCQHGTALAVARELGTVREEGELGAICGTLGLAPATARIP